MVLKGSKMHFEVNGKKYFLGFDSSDGNWQLVTPTQSGIFRMTIVNDDLPVAGPGLWLDQGSEVRG